MGVLWRKEPPQCYTCPLHPHHRSSPYNFCHDHLSPSFCDSLIEESTNSLSFFVLYSMESHSLTLFQHNTIQCLFFIMIDLCGSFSLINTSIFQFSWIPQIIFAGTAVSKRRGSSRILPHFLCHAHPTDLLRIVQFQVSHDLNEFFARFRQTWIVLLLFADRRIHLSYTRISRSFAIRRSYLCNRGLDTLCNDQARKTVSRERMNTIDPHCPVENPFDHNHESARCHR